MKLRPVVVITMVPYTEEGPVANLCKATPGREGATHQKRVPRIGISTTSGDGREVGVGGGAVWRRHKGREGEQEVNVTEAKEELVEEEEEGEGRPARAGAGDGR